MKTCTQCNEVKACTDFHRDKSRSDGYRNVCKLCVTSYMLKYYVDNKHKVLKRAKDWVEANRDRHNKKCAKWVRRNKGKVNARTARRYAAKTNATPVWAVPGTEYAWLINEIYDVAVLRSKLTGIPWEVDHSIPLRGRNVSGLHDPFNLRVIPMIENRRKSNIVSVI